MTARALVLCALLCACGPSGTESPPPATGTPTPAATENEPVDEEVAKQIAALRSTSERERCDAALWLGGRGERAADAIPALEETMADPAPVVGRTAAAALGGMVDLGVAEALPALMRGLEDVRTRAAAVSGMTIAGPKARPAVPLLVRVLEDDEDDVRWQAISALGRIDDDSAAPALARVLDDPSPMLRAEAAWALAEIGEEDADVTRALEAAAKDSAPGVAALTSYALWLRGGEVEKTVTALTRALDRADWRTISRSLTALARIGPEASSALDPVLARLEHPHWEVRAAAASALGGFGIASEPVLSALVRALDDDRNGGGPAPSAAMALGELGPAAAPAARDLARHLDWRLAWYSSGALEKIGPAAIPAIETFLEEEHPPPEVRERALEVIERIRSK